MKAMVQTLALVAALASLLGICIGAMAGVTFGHWWLFGTSALVLAGSVAVLGRSAKKGAKP